MATTSIRLPESLTAFTVFEFCKTLQSTHPAENFVFDFSRTKTVEPFGMLVAASEITKFAKTNPGTECRCAHFQSMSYAAHMGFFKAFGLGFGKNPGEASGSRNYIPLTYFNCEELRRAAAIHGLDVGDEIESQSKRLSETLTGQDEGELFETISYSIREIMRNVVEHAQVEDFGVCAQYWPTKGRAEVAIVDRGIGIRRSIQANPHIDASTDKSSINYALMPAVSGKAFKGAKRLQKRGPWTNSGFGLYMTSRICRNGGTFFISSGDTGMLLTSGKSGKRYYQTGLNGTAVRLGIRTENIESLSSTLQKYRNDGLEIQQKYKEIVSIDPSSASLMLSQDFDMTIWDKLLSTLKLK